MNLPEVNAMNSLEIKVWQTIERKEKHKYTSKFRLIYLFFIDTLKRNQISNYRKVHQKLCSNIRNIKQI